NMDFDSLVEAKSMLGSAGVIVIDEKTSMLDVLKTIVKFYSHESCGQCTPCRIGNAWIRKIVERIAGGKGKPGDIDNIRRLAKNMLQKTLCPLGDAAAMPILAITEKFRKELESYIGN
ncbi:MAG: NADH-quinone oxidoreductase subunit F, partial [Candidatus Aminicenantes bacterium]|nr:NADH-quinone oxidoreductase subunit F [Candidatus Aminicenantes bacterium]